MDKKIVFGLDQLGVNTPEKIKLIYRVIMFLSALWSLGFEPRFPGFAAAYGHTIDSWLIIGNTAIYNFCQCFGVAQPTPPEQLPVAEAFLASK